MRRSALVLMGLFAASSVFAQGAARPLGEYAHYELRDIQAKVEVHPKVMKKLTTELKLRIDEALARWNAEGAKAGHAGTLAVEMVITDMKFVSGNKRFWAGAFAGGSHSAAEVRLVDVESGKVIDTTSFEHKAGSMAGSFSIGAADNAMLDRLAANAASWVIAKHDGTPVPPAEAEAPKEEKKS